MKKRIKQLLVESQLLEAIGENAYEEDDWEPIVEKFTELIVRECTDIVNKRKDAAIDASWDVDEAMSNAVWDIEAHFYGDDE
jgi:hypothetical protein